MVKAIKLFAEEAVKPMPVQTGEYRIALYEYNTEPVTKMPLSRSKKSAFLLALKTIKSKGGSSDVLKAMQFAKTTILSPSETRLKARKVLVLFINGEKQIQNLKLIGDKLAELKASNIEYILVDIGRKPGSQDALKDVAEKHGKFIMIDMANSIPEALPGVLHLTEIQQGIVERFLKNFDNEISYKLMFHLRLSCNKRFHRLSKHFHLILVKASYGPWSEFSICTKSCGGGTKERRRECKNSKPDDDCSTLGPSTELVACNIQPCPGKFYDENSIIRRPTNIKKHIFLI